MDLRNYIENVSRRFTEAGISCSHGTETAYDEAVYLVYGCLDLDFSRGVGELNRYLKEEEIGLLDGFVRRRIEERIPVAYLLGRGWFAGREFFCDPRALIPRSPIAELIGNHFAGLLRDDPSEVLDLCCGGGCIGIAAALELPRAGVDLSDISGDALALASKNIALHKLGKRVSTIQSDLFAGIRKSYDLILCNPPYVSVGEYEQLPLEFRHEPRQGLVSEDSGLAIPLWVIKDARDYLHEDGVLIMEVGRGAAALEQRLPGLPFLWLEFDEGGEGVLALRRSQLPGN